MISSNQIRRLQSVTTSPIYSHFGESVLGVTTIRAYGQQQRFIDISDQLTDNNMRSRYGAITVNRYLCSIVMNIVLSEVLKVARNPARALRNTGCDVLECFCCYIPRKHHWRSCWSLDHLCPKRNARIRHIMQCNCIVFVTGD